MIGTIRKHSAILWWSIVPLTIISFVIFMGQGNMRGGGGGGGLGTIYDKPVTKEKLDAAMREFIVSYWMQRHEFPKRPEVSAAEMDRGAYERLMLEAKAKELGIHVTDEAEVNEANNFLSTLGRDGQPVSPTLFVAKVLSPEGLTAADFQRTIANNLAIQQLVQAFGMAGELVPPQEAAQLYDHQNQEFSAQAVFFSATNYSSGVTVTPEAVGLFYTNHMAEYRLPDRVQLDYVEYDLTNYEAAAEQKLGKTNITAQAEAYFAQHGLESVPGAKTADEAKAKIRDMIVREEAAKEAVDQARQFAKTLFAIDGANANTLLLLAKTNGLQARTTAPFSEEDGPAEFAAPTELTKTAFTLRPDAPFGERPIVGTDAVYMIALARQLPSEIQPFNEIHARVIDDFKNYEAVQRARVAGTNFYVRVTIQMGAGKSFAQAALAAGQAPIALKPFSLSSRDIPEADEHGTETRQMQYVAAQIQPGHMSPFVPSADGGFVLYVQSMLPVDEALKAAEMPKFLAQLRRSRLSEAFNRWLLGEENRELASTPVPKELESARSASNNQ
ncbi:MAG TPA: SurA N-terminal domain-containing protein [Candidatus Acidoferrales bacterium]|nr:SurA N-terminal domain-containing protein [Candidatus Acidoferrales bacterium]